MRPTSALLFMSFLALAGCGSNLNPFNWFGDSSSAPVEVSANTNPLIPEDTGVFSSNRSEQAVYRGTAIETVSSLAVERLPGGAIIRAEGVAAVQGVFDVRLTPTDPEERPVDGVLTYRLEGIRPTAGQPGTAPQTRQVVAARQVTDRTLEGVRTIRVEGLQNAQVSRR